MTIIAANLRLILPIWLEIAYFGEKKLRNTFLIEIYHRIPAVFRDNFGQ